MIQAGRTITFDVQGTTGEWIPRTVANVRQQAIDGLTPFFDVLGVTVESESFLSDPIHYVTAWPYRATVRAATRDDYGDIRDVDSIVAHAFYDASGGLPTVTASGYEQGQGDPDVVSGPGLLGVGVLGIVALGIVAFIAFKVA